MIVLIFSCLWEKWLCKGEKK